MGISRVTSPPEKITVYCPSCGKDYEDWYRASINLELDDFDDEYLEEATSSKCKHCGHVVKHDSLIVGEDGIWRSGMA